jgi:hypothetical protein
MDLGRDQREFLNVLYLPDGGDWEDDRGRSDQGSLRRSDATRSRR